MSELGLAWNQIGIDTTTYGVVWKLVYPAICKNVVQHVVSSSTRFPTRDAGYAPARLTGTLRMDPDSVVGFVAAVTVSTTERRISWMLGTTEIYGYAKSGSITHFTVMNPYRDATRVYLVGFEFRLSRSTIYLASDDSPLMGG